MDNKTTVNAASRMWEVLLPIFIYMGITLFMELMAMVLIYSFTIANLVKNGIELDLYTVTEYSMTMFYRYSFFVSAAAALFCIPIGHLLMRRDDLRWGSTEEKYDKVSAAYYGVCLVIGVSACLAINNMMSLSGLFGAMAEELDQLKSQLYPGMLAVECVAIGVISPIVEEILFRGVIHRRIRRNIGSNRAIIFSAILFGCYHGNFLQFLYTFILGLLFGFVYEKYKNLLAPILVHMGANLVSVIGSETKLLDPMYGTDTRLIIGTMVWCLILFVGIHLVYYNVEPSTLRRSEEERQEES